MIIHKKPSVMRHVWPDISQKSDFEKDVYADRTSCSKKITPEWMKQGEGNVVYDPSVFKFELWRQENGTLDFTREVCEDCILRDSLVELGSMDLEGEEDARRADRAAGMARRAEGRKAFHAAMKKRAV